MTEPIIVYTRGLWSHPKTVKWIADNLQEATGIQVELFDYHDELVEDIDNETYTKRIIEKYGDFYGSKSNKVILYGHSHGGAFGIILNKTFGTRKLIVSNPALQPWGLFRQIPNRTKQLLAKHNIGNGYTPHYILKYDGEIEERMSYFNNNINFMRDLSRVLAVGKEASQLAHSIQSDFLAIQSMSDEFASVKPNLKFYDKINLPNRSSDPAIQPTKEIIQIIDREHAIMEETGVYPMLNEAVDNFIKRGRSR